MVNNDGVHASKTETKKNNKNKRCKACPRSWFEGGETISVVAAPIPSVSTGRISFNITSHLGAAVGSGSNEIVADVAFVATASASGVAAAAAESAALPTVVTLSFRTPLLPPQTQTQSPTPTPTSPASPYSKWLLTAVTVRAVLFYPQTLRWTSRRRG